MILLLTNPYIGMLLGVTTVLGIIVFTFWAITR